MEGHIHGNFICKLFSSWGMQFDYVAIQSVSSDDFCSHAFGRSLCGPTKPSIEQCSGLSFRYSDISLFLPIYPRTATSSSTKCLARGRSWTIALVIAVAFAAVVGPWQNVNVWESQPNIIIIKQNSRQSMSPSQQLALLQTGAVGLAIEK